MTIFDELMSQGSMLTESVKKSTPKKINYKKLKVESIRIMESDDELELDDFDIPEDIEAPVEGKDDEEVVLVIDPEIKDDEEVPEDAAEEMVGDYVYKCPICGANYICDCNATETEGIEVDDNGVPTECPICGDDAEQILVGEIAPAEGAGEADSMDAMDVEDNEDASEEDVEEEEKEEELEDEEEEEETEKEESFNRHRILVQRRMEAVRRAKKNSVTRRKSVSESAIRPRKSTRLSESKKNNVIRRRPVIESKRNTSVDFDDTKFNLLMNRSVIRENYEGNHPVFKLSNVVVKNNKIKFEYVVREGKRVQKGVMIGEGFNNNARRMTLSLKNKGVFTESLTKTPAFVVECVKTGNMITPTKLVYDFKTRVNESLYRVTNKRK